MRELDSSLSFLSGTINNIKNQLESISQMFFVVKILDRYAYYGNRIEFERYFFANFVLNIY